MSVECETSSFLRRSPQFLEISHSVTPWLFCHVHLRHARQCSMLKHAGHSCGADATAHSRIWPFMGNVYSREQCIAMVGPSLEVRPTSQKPNSTQALTPCVQTYANLGGLADLIVSKLCGIAPARVPAAQQHVNASFLCISLANGMQR
jgi:hypothetical protein